MAKAPPSCTSYIWGGASSAVAPPFALSLPCRGDWPASREKGELCLQAGDRTAQPGREAAGTIKGRKPSLGVGVQPCEFVLGREQGSLTLPGGCPPT